MIVVKAYSYPNTVEVQIFDTSIFTVRNRTVYSRPIKVYQGIDNPIQVIIRNQDQKSVDLTGYTVQASIQDPVNKVTINTYAVTFSDITKGLGNFTLDADTLNTLENRIYKLTFKTINVVSNSEAPLYIDDNYGAPLDLVILPAYYAETTSETTEVIFDGGTI